VVPGRDCGTYNRNAIVIRRTGQNRKRSAAADAESGNVAIVSISDINVITGIAAAPAPAGLRNEEITAHDGEEQQTAENLKSSHSISSYR
jgi:hypothetical protein